jgi:hypothetical protein
MKTRVEGLGAPGPLIASALTAVMGDGSVTLSPQSEILARVVSTVLEGVAGKAIASLAADVAADLLGDVATSAVSAAVDAVGAIPLLGTIVSWVKGIVDDVAGLRQEEVEKKSALLQQCAKGERFFKPVPTYSEGSVPADLFGVYDADDAAKLGGTWATYQGGPQSAVTMLGEGSDGWSMQARRPALGAFLIALTEGARADGESYMVPSLMALGGSGRRAASYEAVVGLSRVFLKNQSLGVPAPRLAQFRALRLAIEAQRKHEPRGSTDGGVALWPLYMDLLAAEYKAGHLTNEFVFLMSDASTPCPSPGLTTQVRALTDSWTLRLDPWYAAGVAEQAKVREQALTIARSAGVRKTRRPRIRLSSPAAGGWVPAGGPEVSGLEPRWPAPRRPRRSSR